MAKSEASSRCLVLLGASNVSLGLCHALQAVERGTQDYSSICAAIGHGRSYGLWSSIVGRAYPGIIDSGLWQHLQELPKNAYGPRLQAILTDVGNDLLYGVEVPQILEWVDQCLHRLVLLNAEIMVTALPQQSLERLGPLRYGIVRRLFFPRNAMSYSLVMDRAIHLNQGLLALVEQYGLHLCEPAREWFGWDPIHIKRSARRKIWWQWIGQEDPIGNAPTLFTRGRCITFRPQCWKFFGRNKQTAQPRISWKRGAENQQQETEYQAQKAGGLWLF